jgi:dUTP pyrophosphatase
MKTPLVKFRLLRDDARVPQRATEGSSGYDIVAVDCMSIGPGCWEAIPTGLSMEIPAGYEAQVRPRSGLALKRGVTVLNAPGTIDSDYRGEVKVLLVNHNSTAFAVTPGDKIAQLVFAQVEFPAIELTGEIKPSKRGAGGFGSTDTGWCGLCGKHGALVCAHVDALAPNTPLLCPACAAKHPATVAP